MSCDADIWKEPETVGTDADCKFSATSIAQSLSVIFDDLRVEVQGSDAPLDETRTLSFRVPASVPAECRVIGYLEDLIGGVLKSKGARAVIVLDIGGTTHVAEFPYGMDETSASGLSMFTRRFFSPQGVDIASALGVGIAEPPPLQVSIFLSVQRRTLDDFVLLAVDSLDVVAFLDSK
jgi:hypothetical protein